MSRFTKSVLVLFVLLALLGAAFYRYARGSRLRPVDIATFFTDLRPVGVLGADSLARLGLKPADLRDPASAAGVQFIGLTRYLNHTHAVVTHTIDDSTRYVPMCLDAIDKYGIKATIFVSTQVSPVTRLWPRLEQAIKNGHEIGSHSRRHQCQWPDTFLFCFRAYTDYEISGSRNDILRHTSQPYVWSWCYPCGNCNSFEFVHRKLAHAGYIVARNYPGEAEDHHIMPNLQTYDTDPYNATYTEVVQKQGGIAKSGRTNITEVNAKFDEVYARDGIYNFMSHPQWLDFGPDKFYERHLAYLGGRSDIWYVPMGLLYAYHTVREHTKVSALDPQQFKARFVVYNNLDPKVFLNSVTLEFHARSVSEILSNDKPIRERGSGLTDRWNDEYFRREGDSIYVTIQPNTILEFK
ncbi:MAG TPA: polysaccharide deacetylase family protein [Bryobacteraceae bacterium]|nr:polysaccharide deacetylase family protein [Bryobacteraceae bacterium]